MKSTPPREGPYPVVCSVHPLPWKQQWASNTELPVERDAAHVAGVVVVCDSALRVLSTDVARAL